MLFCSMRDLQGIDNLLLNELKSCCAKEYNFLPREAGLNLMESTSPEVTYFLGFSHLISEDMINAVTTYFLQMDNNPSY